MGNSNPWLAITQQLDHPIVVDKIRFLPYSHHPRTTCMRVEIYGCLWRGHYFMTLSTTPVIIHHNLTINPPLSLISLPVIHCSPIGCSRSPNRHRNIEPRWIRWYLQGVYWVMQSIGQHWRRTTGVRIPTISPTMVPSMATGWPKVWDSSPMASSPITEHQPTPLVSVFLLLFIHPVALVLLRPTRFSVRGGIF